MKSPIKEFGAEELNRRFAGTYISKKVAGKKKGTFIYKPTHVAHIRRSAGTLNIEHSLVGDRSPRREELDLSIFQLEYPTLGYVKYKDYVIHISRNSTRQYLYGYTSSQLSVRNNRSGLFSQIIDPLITRQASVYPDVLKEVFKPPAERYESVDKVIEDLFNLERWSSPISPEWAISSSSFYDDLLVYDNQQNVVGTVNKKGDIVLGNNVSFFYDELNQICKNKVRIL